MMAYQEGARHGENEIRPAHGGSLSVAKKKEIMSLRSKGYRSSPCVAMRLVPQEIVQQLAGEGHVTAQQYCEFQGWQHEAMVPQLASGQHVLTAEALQKAGLINCLSCVVS